MRTVLRACSRRESINASKLGAPAAAKGRDEGFSRQKQSRVWDQYTYSSMKVQTVHEVSRNSVENERHWATGSTGDAEETKRAF